MVSKSVLMDSSKIINYKRNTFCGLARIADAKTKKIW